MTTTFSTLNKSNISTKEQKPATKQNFLSKIQGLALILENTHIKLKKLTEQADSIRQAKLNVQGYLQQKSQENKQRLMGQLKKYQNQVRLSIQNSKKQTEKIDQKINTLKNGQIQSLQLILGIQRRVQQLQIQAGIQVD